MEDKRATSKEAVARLLANIGGDGDGVETPSLQTKEDAVSDFDRVFKDASEEDGESE